MLDEDDFESRDDLITCLVVNHAWPTAKVGEFFGLTARHVRRVASAGLPVSKRPPVLTLDEARRMVNDYLNDPYIKPGEREDAFQWIESLGLRIGSGYDDDPGGSRVR